MRVSCPLMKTRSTCRESLVLGVVAATLALALATIPTATAGAAGSSTATGGAAPTVTGPIAGTPLISSTKFDLAPFGYLQEEYLFSGDASAYTSATPLSSNGEWTVTPASSAPYTSRLLVVRPADPEDFNGTVWVEWLNVTSRFDAAPTWTQMHLELLREGAAWVGVSAQAIGVQGAPTPAEATAPGGLKGSDPERYGSLTHPGDSYSYDIFTQAAAAVRGEGAVAPLGPLTPKRVIAAGESQSATRLVTYIDGIQPRSEAFDGFLVFSRFGGAAALSQAPLPDIPAPVPTLIRKDLGVPVMTYLTETDVGPLGAAAARQPDTKRLRTWEVAGTSHADAYTTMGFNDTGDGSLEVKLLDYTASPPGAFPCATTVNTGPTYAVLMAGVQHLDDWVRNGTAPPKGARLEVTDGPGRTVSGVTVPNFVITRDPQGNAVGGVRSPLVDAPRAALSGEFNTGAQFCNLFGTTVPFDAATIAARYPSRDAFLAEFAKTARRAVKQGFLLPEEAEKLQAAAAQVPFGA